MKYWLCVALIQSDHILQRLVTYSDRQKQSMGTALSISLVPRPFLYGRGKIQEGSGNHTNYQYHCSL